MNVETIHSYLHDYGWTYQPSGNSCVLTGWEGEHGEYPLEIKINQTCMRFSVSPLIELNFPRKPPSEMIRFLLGLNESTHFVKLNIKSSGKVNLYIDVLTSSISYEVFTQTIEIIGYYCDMLSTKIIEKQVSFIKPKLRRELN